MGSKHRIIYIKHSLVKEIDKTRTRFYCDYNLMSGDQYLIRRDLLDIMRMKTFIAGELNDSQKK